MATRAAGVDGDFGAVTGHGGIIRTWNLNLPRPVSNVTGFGDTTQRNRTGIPDINGSFAGVPDLAASGDPGALTDIGLDVDLVLTVAPSCTYTIKAQLSNFTLSSDKTADAPLSWDFVGGEGDSNIVEAWTV